MAIPDTSSDYEWLERLKKAYDAVGFASQPKAVEEAKKRGVTGVDQPLLSDWLLAVKRRRYQRTVSDEKRPSLYAMTRAFEGMAREDQAARPIQSRVIIGEIRAKLDELEGVLPTSPPEAPSENPDQVAPETVEGRKGPDRGAEDPAQEDEATGTDD